MAVMPREASGLAASRSVAAPAGASARLGTILRDPRRAITEQEIVCLVCGGAFRHLTNTHLAAHGLTPRGYKRQFGYNAGRPLMCRALVRLYAERAVRTGLASHIRRRPIVEDPALRRAGGARIIAREELLTRRDVQGRYRPRWSERDDRGRFARRGVWYDSGGGV
jgi:predicted transcriptional regulator